MFKKITLSFTVCLSTFCSYAQKTNVDLIIHNAKIYSVDSSFATHQAMAISKGKIIEISSDKTILKKYTSKKIKDVGNKTIVPGLIDAHCHFVNYGLGLRRIGLTGTKSFAEVIQRVIDFTDKSGERKALASKPEDINWIVGRGWDQNVWEVKEYPTNRQLDSLFPKTPVILRRVDGHAALVNSEALRRANINVDTKISGGEIFVKDGKLTGMLIDNAVDIVMSKIPPASKKLIEQGLLAAQKDCFEVGLTTVDDAGLMKSDIDIIDELQKSKQLKMRIYAMASDSAPNYAHYLKTGPYKTDRLNVRSFKFYADGSLGSRGACLLQHYHDKPNSKGFMLSTKEHFEKYATILAQKGFQMNTHCIGDSSDRVIAKIYTNALNALTNGKVKPMTYRWRVEHAQVVDKNDLAYYSGIIPSVQPTHATSDMYWAEARLGKERVKTAYAYKDLLKAAGVVALGTDFPVEEISPFFTFYAAVARKDAKFFPEGGFQIENALTREETLKGMTIWAAFSNFEEKEKGSLEKGKFADFIILDTDIMTCEINEVLKTKVISTYVNGELVYSLIK